jgi:hypothetical protein
MSVQYRCQNQKRAQILRDSAIPLNGIDYLAVLDQEAPADSPPQQTLLVRMLKATPWGLTVNNVQIEGGVRVTPVSVVWVIQASEAADAMNPLISTGTITAAEADFFAALPDAEQILVARTDSTGDFSTYRLKLAQSATNPAPPTGFDPILSQVDFSFKVDCPSEFDCETDLVCPPEIETAPQIDYLAKDFASFRRLMLDRLAVTMPDWQERNPADLGMALVEALAYAADYLSYYQDAVATEAYLGTARRRTSVRRHARLLDYAMHEGCNARAWVQARVNADNVTLPASSQLLTRVSGQPARLPPNSRAYEQSLAQNPTIFETMHEATFFVAHNQIEFYTWGEENCCLPTGATSATLLGHLPDLQAGGLLIFAEVRGSETGKAADADPARRHAVRLTHVTLSEDPLGGQFLDPPDLNPLPVTEIEWQIADALLFPLCLWVVDVPPEERSGSDPAQQPVSLALGNIVLADHGLTIQGEVLPTVLESARYRPTLEETNVTHRVKVAVDDETLAAKTLIAQNPRQALPAIVLTEGADTWAPQRDLLASGRFTPEFVVETENDGRAFLRFGDNVYGRRPPLGTTLSADYRVGNGLQGNVGAEAIAHVVSNDNGITAVHNPLPAVGGAAPESMAEVRLYAPQAFRTQERAVTEADYAAVAQRHPEVQRAVATRRWTGSWYTMFLTVDRRSGLPVDAAFEAALRLFLERFRLAGQDLEIDGPRFVSLDIAFIVCVEANYFRSDVKAALLETFSNADLPGGGRGFFHPDNFTFGQPVYLSQVVAAAMQVPGVRWVDTDHDSAKPNRFQRWGQSARGEFEAGQIDLGRLEIARLDNDPNAPENGKIEFIMEGGL